MATLADCGYANLDRHPNQSNQDTDQQAAVSVLNPAHFRLVNESRYTQYDPSDECVQTNCDTFPYHRDMLRSVHLWKEVTGLEKQLQTLQPTWPGVQH